jgi:hypothetical protein|tara:strand:- start:2360 stop:3079 length:720 start_codon:yes stop_codon:yes gene_type:complete
MKIKNQKTGNMIEFDGDQFKKLLKIQNTMGTEYFSKTSLVACNSKNSKASVVKCYTNPKGKPPCKEKFHQKTNKKGEMCCNKNTKKRNSKTRQKGGVVDPDQELRKYDQENECIVCMTEYDNDKRKVFQIDECKHELCMQCAKRWFVTDKKERCPICKRDVINENVRKQISVEEQLVIMRNIMAGMQNMMAELQNEETKTEMQRMMVQMQNLINERDQEKLKTEMPRLMVQMQNLINED